MIGTDCRIGLPNEHMAKAPSDDIISPLFATGVGLVIKGYEKMPKPMRQEQSEAEHVRKKREEKGPNAFLKKIKEWFENEEE